MVKSIYWKINHTFRIDLPKTLEEDYWLDKDSGTDYWRKAINKDMKMVQVAFGFKEEVKCVTLGYQEITCHVIFNVNMDFTGKAHSVTGGHQKEPPASATCDSVVSKYAVHIALLISELNDVDVLSLEI